MELAVRRGLLLEGRDQAKFVERRGTQVVDQAANVNHRCLHLQLQVGEEPVGSGGILLEQVAGRVEPKREARKCRTKFVECLSFLRYMVADFYGI